MPLWRPGAGGYNGQDRLFGQSEIFSWTQLFVQLQDMLNRKKEPTFQLNISCSVLLAYILGGDSVSKKQIGEKSCHDQSCLDIRGTAIIDSSVMNQLLLCL